MAAAAGLGWPGLYRDNPLVTAGWRGNDVVTLVVAVPALTLARQSARRGSATGHLLWIGLVDYALYGYLFYLFGSALNAAFLLYVVVVTAASAALVQGIATALSGGIGRALATAPAGGVAVFLALLAAGLGTVHLSALVGFVATGQLPAIVSAVAHPTHVIAALDLWLVVAWSAVAAYGVWRRRPLGFVLAAAVTVKGAFYMAALAAATVAAWQAGAGPDVSQAGLWIAIGVACAAAATRLLRPVRGLTASG
ncbi:MAG: hypothetical protein AB7U83_20595 [Vicinamibacterales bacterium]